MDGTHAQADASAWVFVFIRSTTIYGKHGRFFWYIIKMILELKFL